MDNTIKNLSKEELLSSFGGCNYKWVVIDGELIYVEEKIDMHSD